MDAGFARFTLPIDLPAGAPVFDFSRGPKDEAAVVAARFGIGRFGERRPGTYSAERYLAGPSPREYHMGLDLFAPAGTPVRAWCDGEIWRTGYNPLELDYGYTIVTRHELRFAASLSSAVTLFALHGHLSAASIEGKREGQRFSRGETIAWVGERGENGGWLPHLHLQLSHAEPAGIDMPGVVAREDLELALLTYVDPRTVFGAIY